MQLLRCVRKFDIAGDSNDDVLIASAHCKTATQCDFAVRLKCFVTVGLWMWINFTKSQFSVYSDIHDFIVVTFVHSLFCIDKHII